MDALFSCLGEAFHLFGTEGYPRGSVHYDILAGEPLLTVMTRDVERPFSSGSGY